MGVKWCSQICELVPIKMVWDIHLPHTTVGRCCWHFVLQHRMGEDECPASKGRRWEVVGLCVCVMTPASRGSTFLGDWRGWAEEGAWWEQRSTALLPWGFSEVLEALTAGRNSPRRRRQGNHKPVTNLPSFLQPIPSTNHVWKYSIQASSAMASKNHLTSVDTYFPSSIFPLLWVCHRR